MIGSVNGGRRKSRERTPGRDDVYALRKLLIRRLQASTRGVTRRERVGAWRKFAEAWQEAVSEGRLEEISCILNGTREVGPRVGILERLSAVPGGVETAAPGVNGAVRIGALSQEGEGAPPVDQGETEPNWRARTGFGHRGCQVELFAPGLVSQSL